MKTTPLLLSLPLAGACVGMVLVNCSPAADTGDGPGDERGAGGGGAAVQEASAAEGAPPPAAAPVDPEKAAAFAEACAELAAASAIVNVQGADPDWLFLKTELLHLAEGELDDAPTAQAAAKEIVAYHNALKSLGVDLVVVPVPAKGAVYPEKVAGDRVPTDGGLPVEGSVFPTGPFLAGLRAQGVDVIDLEPLFRQAREEAPEGPAVCCAQDAHWSPRGAEIAAAAVADHFAGAVWVDEVEKQEFAVGEPEPLSIKGDLVFGQHESMEDETVIIRRAGVSTGGTIDPVDEDPQSPLLLLGDSHLQVFTDGGAEMHCKGAGFRDHLQAKLGFAAASVSNRASGGDSARATLVRSHVVPDPGYWSKKKAVVWIFSVREFTQGKWRTIPAQP